MNTTLSKKNVTCNLLSGNQWKCTFHLLTRRCMSLRHHIHLQEDNTLSQLIVT